MPRPRTGQRERIAHATGHLFRHKGYHGTSMSDISAAVGLSKATLYSHVSAKHDVLRELVDRGATLFTDGIAAIAATNNPAPTKIRHALRMHLTIVADHPDLAAVFLHEWRQLNGDARARINTLRDDYEATWRRILTDGVRTGHFRPNLDIRIATLTLLSCANWATQWYNPHGPLTANDVADRFATLILNGMVARTADTTDTADTADMDSDTSDHAERHRAPRMSQRGSLP